ncbi:MAG: cytidine deaminase [Eubacteriales bacterium]|nr:cytidine deaminase [Eubacteriales bacterium]
MEETAVRALLEEAKRARLRSYSPYSGYQVGAALLTAQGKVYSGCNIENAAFSPTNCAERTAFFTAVAAGEREFSAIAIAGGPKGGEPDFAWPCGVCRQVMREFCDPESFLVIAAGPEGDWRLRRLAGLLPESFGPEHLK